MLQLWKDNHENVAGYNDEPARTYLDVRLLMTPVVVSNWTESAKMSAIPIAKLTPSSGYEATLGYSPMPESKSGTMAAKVTMNSCKFLRKSDH